MNVDWAALSTAEGLREKLAMPLKKIILPIVIAYATKKGKDTAWVGPLYPMAIMK